MYRQKTIKLKFDYHHNQKVVCFLFEKDHQLIQIIKTKLSARWSNTKRYWYLPHDKFDINQTLQTFKNKAWIDIREISSQTDKNGNNSRKVIFTEIHNEIAYFQKWLNPNYALEMRKRCKKL